MWFIAKGPGDVEEEHEQWKWPPVVLSGQVKKEIEAECLKIFIAVFFRTHMYTFGGKMYRQLKGGPIGPRCTCALARCVMNVFDRKLEWVCEQNWK